MAGLYYPTLDLFYYYAKEGFGIEEKEVEYFDTYWKSLQIKYNTKENPIYFLEKLPENQGEIDGQFRRQNLGESNGFYFGCSLDEQNKSHSSTVVTKLKERLEQEIFASPLEEILNLPDPSKKSLCLGYTWMTYGWIDVDQSDEEKIELAKNFYHQLVGKEWQHQRGGKLLGAKIIEAWRSHHEWDLPDVGSHVIIILYPNKNTYAKASKELISDSWIPLLLYRHKIWFSYQKSRRNKEKIRQTFNKATSDLREHNTYNLEQLGKALERNRQSLNNYSIDLNAISIHQHTLDTNLDDYNLVVKQLIEKANDDCIINHFWANDLKFLEEFSTIASVKYKKQLEKDYATLAPGLAALNGLTETIRGLVEVQQAEIDRHQTNTIAIVGLGLAASSAVAGIAATQVYQPSQPTSLPTGLPTGWPGVDSRIHWGQGLLWSLSPTAIAIAFLAFLWYQHHRKLNK